MLLNDDESAAQLTQIPGWTRAGKEIQRDFQFADFKTALAFVNRVAEAAEAMDHHPDIFLHSWNKVRLNLMTHSQGGLTQKDFTLAAQINKLS